MLIGDELALTAPAAEERFVPARQLGAFLHALHDLEPAAPGADPPAALPGRSDEPRPSRPAWGFATLTCLDRLGSGRPRGSAERGRRS